MHFDGRHFPSLILLQFFTYQDSTVSELNSLEQDKRNSKSGCQFGGFIEVIKPSTIAGEAGHE